MLKRLCLLVTSALFLASSVAWARAETSQDEVAREINLVTASATSVIAALQEKINAKALTESDIAPARVEAAFKTAFEKVAKVPLDAPTDPVRADVRSTAASAFKAVMETFRGDMLKGGQDAFVPAFFRAQLLTRFNAASKGRYQAIVTNRPSDLINRDSAPDRVVPDAQTLAYVEGLMQDGSLAQQSRSFGGRHVSYWPMAIAEPCAVCHQRNGLEQNVGQFGGATVVIVEAMPRP